MGWFAAYLLTASLTGIFLNWLQNMMGKRFRRPIMGAIFWPVTWALIGKGFFGAMASDISRRRR